jgi:hypothetical protein
MRLRASRNVAAVCWSPVTVVWSRQGSRVVDQAVNSCELDWMTAAVATSGSAAVTVMRQHSPFYFGEVQGAPTPGWLGLHPGQ